MIYQINKIVNNFLNKLLKTYKKKIFFLVTAYEKKKQALYRSKLLI